jgi:hypothetical protein
MFHRRAQVGVSKEALGGQGHGAGAVEHAGDAAVGAGVDGERVLVAHGGTPVADGQVGMDGRDHVRDVPMSVEPAPVDGSVSAALRPSEASASPKTRARVMLLRNSL